MKKLIVIPMLLFILILSSCNSSRLALSEIEEVPDKVQEVINPDLTLQLLNDGEKDFYLIFHSNGDAEADLDMEGDTLTIIFDELDSSDPSKQQHVYHVTTDGNQEILDVLINGESASFDEYIL